MSESKVCVVTGASSGIGRAFAVRLDSLGHKVCLLGRRRDKLQEVAAALSAGETCAVQCSAVQCSAV
jgi:NADP-dependent 3-hydroxy acid dehydrogenase YdfG